MTTMMTAKEARELTDKAVGVREEAFNQQLQKVLMASQLMIEATIGSMKIDRQQLPLILVVPGKTYNGVMVKLEHLEPLIRSFEALGYTVKCVNGTIHVSW